MKKKIRHRNEAWFDEDGNLCIKKNPNQLNYNIQNCMYQIHANKPLFCGLWCPRCRYITNNKISVCGENYLTEEYFGKK